MRWFGESPALPFFGEWEFSLLESPLNSMYRRSISGVIIIVIVAVGVFESKVYTEYSVLLLDRPNASNYTRFQY